MASATRDRFLGCQSIDLLARLVNLNIGPLQLSTQIKLKPVPFDLILPQKGQLASFYGTQEVLLPHALVFIVFA